jgi:hypothetical protein
MPGISRYFPIVSLIPEKTQLSTVFKDLPLGFVQCRDEIEVGKRKLVLRQHEIFFWIKDRRRYAQVETIGPETSVGGHHRTVGVHVVAVTVGMVQAKGVSQFVDER